MIVTVVCLPSQVGTSSRGAPRFALKSRNERACEGREVTQGEACVVASVQLAESLLDRSKFQLASGIEHSTQFQELDAHWTFPAPLLLEVVACAAANARLVNGGLTQ
jgi:hypothetical protein